MPNNADQSLLNSILQGWYDNNSHPITTGTAPPQSQQPPPPQPVPTPEAPLHWAVDTAFDPPEPEEDDWDDPVPVEPPPAYVGSIPKGVKKEEDSATEMKIETTAISKIVKFETEMLEIDAKQAFTEFSARLDAMGVSKKDIPRPSIPSINAKGQGIHVGIEIEIEQQILHPKTGVLGISANFTVLRGYFYHVWDETVDNSLRNEGKEYVTKPGLTADQAPWALALLKLYLSCFYQDSEVNYRCGTHVHVEVREFTVAQLINMTCLYILFEDLFYRVSGERYKNIFCVPLRASVSEVERMFCLIHKEKPTYDDFRNIFKHFKKYMAYNLLPVARMSHIGPAIGTVEFRHHEGESNPTALCEWLQYILDIHYTARLMDFPALREIIFALNSRSDYLGFARQVFSKLPVNMTNADIVSDMYAGSGFIKELYLQAKGL